MLRHGSLKNVKHDAGDTSDYAKETHAGANKKNMTNGPWKMCRFVFFVFCFLSDMFRMLQIVMPRMPVTIV